MTLPFAPICCTKTTCLKKSYIKATTGYERWWFLASIRLSEPDTYVCKPGNTTILVWSNDWRQCFLYLYFSYRICVFFQIWHFRLIQKIKSILALLADYTISPGPVRTGIMTFWTQHDYCSEPWFISFTQTSKIVLNNVCPRCISKIEIRVYGRLKKTYVNNTKCSDVDRKP